MLVYPENYDITVTVVFTDLNGNPVTPSEVRAVLYDGEDREIADFGSLPFDAGEDRKEIVIPAAFNILGDGELQAARILRVSLVTDAGEIRRSSSYIIEGQFRLVVMENSFMTIEAAEILARDVPRMMGWPLASDDDKQAALISAFNRMTRIPMKFANDPVEAIQQQDKWGYGLDGYLPATNYRPYHWTKDLVGRYGPVETIIPAAAWRSITAEEFQSYPAHFRRAVRMAQLVEADDILENDVTVRRHRQGIISETVGESSVMLRGGHILAGLSRRALECLNGYIYYNFRITRA